MLGSSQSVKKGTNVNQGGFTSTQRQFLDAFHLTKNNIFFQNIGKIYEKSRKIKNKNLRGKNKNVGPRQVVLPRGCSALGPANPVVRLVPRGLGGEVRLFGSRTL